MLRRYLDTCPIVPHERASSSALDGLGNRWHASTADMDEGRLDIFFARQCLSRHYPDLLSPPSLVVNRAAASGVAVKKQETSCSARALGLEGLAATCASCTSEVCARRRKPEDFVRVSQACGYDKPPGGVNPKFRDVVDASGNIRSSYVIPAFHVSTDRLNNYGNRLDLETVQQMTHVIDIEQSLEVPCAHNISSARSCRCYADKSRCAQEIQKALTILAMHPECTSQDTGERDDSGLAIRAEHRSLQSTSNDQLPPPSAMALMLAAARGQQFLDVW